MAIQLEVVTPLGVALDLEVSSVTAPGALGELQVLPAHLPSLIQLSGGTLRYAGDSAGQLYIRGGVAEVSAEKVLILTEELQSPETLDKERAAALNAQVSKALAESAYLSDEQLSRLQRDQRFAEAVLAAAG